jgi:hypothetical protein
MNTDEKLRELSTALSNEHRLERENARLRAALEDVRSSGENSHRINGKWGDVTIAGAAYLAVLAALQ